MHGGRTDTLPGPGRGIRRDDPGAQNGGSEGPLGRDDELAALQRLDDQARRLERRVTSATFPQLVDQERRGSADYRERSVFGWEPPPARTGSR